MRELTLSRKELHELVWEESLPSLAKKYNVTYHEIRQICVGMNIPLPKAGYWQNKWLGKTVVIEPLSKQVVGQEEVTLQLLEEGDERKPKLNRSPTAFIEKGKEDLYSVSERLTKPDPLNSCCTK